MFGDSLLFSLILFIVGIFFLYKGSDFLVLGASRTAVRYGVPPLIIGLTIVAYGTSLPELSVSLGAIIRSNPETDISIGNVVGSNVANILLVLGVCAIIKPLKVTKSVVSREGPIMLAVSWLLVILILVSKNGELGRFAGVTLLIAFAMFVAYFMYISIKSDEGGEMEKPESGVAWKNILMIIGGIGAVIFGAQFLIKSAIFIAEYIGVSPAIIALTIVAVGTSLPELVISVMATYKDHADLSIGNVLGSNIFNILLILGLCLMVTNIALNRLVVIDIVIMLLVSAFLIPILWTGYVLSRREGIVLLIAYAVFVAYHFL